MKRDLHAIKNGIDVNSKDESLSCFKCKRKDGLSECEYDAPPSFPNIKVIICNKCRERFPWDSDCIKQEKLEDLI